MSTSFTLSHEGQTFTLGIDGTVSQNDQQMGAWNTDENSNVVIRQLPASPTLPFDFDAEAPVLATIPAVWKFNDKNQLTLASSEDPSTELINFHKTGKLPVYATRDAVLLCRPDRTFAFHFSLRGEWDLSESHDLKLTINETASVIDGFVNDAKSRFIYHFFDKERADINGHLGFVGTWDAQVVDGGPMLSFTYKREGGSLDTFSLPKAMTIDRGTNQFLYQYDKDNQTFSIQLIGFLEVSENFQITYSLDRQTARSGEELVGQTTFSLQATYVNDKFSGDFRLQFTKGDGTGGSELVLSGQMTAALGDTKLQIGFAFSQKREGETVETRALFNGSLEFKNGRIQWAFEQAATTTTISIAASDIRLGEATTFDWRVLLRAENGQIQQVTALFGISF